MNVIAAQVTPVGHGGIAIIRVCGKSALELVAPLFRGRRSLSIDKRLYYGTLCSCDGGSPIDEVLLTVYNPDDNPTRELMVEISCHGGQQVVNTILAALEKRGIKILNPLEMLNYSVKTMDSIQALALRCLLQAKTRLTVKFLLAQVQGALSQAIREIIKDIGCSPLKAIKMLEDLLSLGDLGCALNSATPIAIVGRPNSGKSTLFNSLAGWDRALVDPLPGTTRDPVSTIISIHGIPFKILDTAGIRTTDDQIEKLGISASLREIEDAKTLIVVMDLTSTPENIVSDLKKTQHRIVVFNKIDIASDAVSTFLSLYPDGFPISALTGQGMDKLKNILLSPFLPLLNHAFPYPLIFNHELQKEIEKARKELAEHEHEKASKRLEYLLGKEVSFGFG